MSTFDFDARRQRDREAQRQERRDRELLKADVQAMFNSQSTRRVMAAFLEDMGLDASPFSPNAMTQSHAIGRQEAARWWVQQIRAYCPEKEQVMRIERQQAAQEQSTEDETDEH